MPVNHVLGTSKTAEFRVAMTSSLSAALADLEREHFDTTLLELNLPPAASRPFARIHEVASGAQLLSRDHRRPNRADAGRFFGGV